MNILTFDLEDWYQLAHRKLTGELPAPQDALLRQTDLLLDLLDRHQTRATFFVLGMVAERYPRLIRRIAEQGHEIASHGHAHLRVSELSRKQFENDVRQSLDIIQDITGKVVRGYRAPEFSINRRTLWALDVLASLGITYDSSIFPIYHPRYGIPRFSPFPVRYPLPGGLEITELPLATISLAGVRAPVAGGGYFRLLPLWALQRALRRHEVQQLPMTTYFHPYEFDTIPLNSFQTISPKGWKRSILAWRMNWRNNIGRAGVRRKIAAMLETRRFATCQEYLDEVRIAENQVLLPRPG